MSWNGDPTYYVNFRAKRNGKDEEAYSIFRCGLAHEYFVKGVALVHNNDDDPNHHVPDDKGFGWHDHAGQAILRFHTNAYFRDLRPGFAKLQTDAKSDPGKRASFTDAVTRVRGRVATQ